ncbi:MAG TPA: DUF1553 domain-containing protein [Thermoanaerobaculia bacterium]|nr:DUF1553 domain-containing protein [Thermoanaerobaculia bacterium]
MKILLAVLILSESALYAQDCTYNPARVEPIAKRLSQQAEAVAPTRRRAVAKPNPPAFVAKNFIDDEIFGAMTTANIRWTEPASGAEFLRRVTLDLTGQIPDAATVKSFLADTSSDKRDRAIERLLASEEFVDRWTLWLGDSVRNVAIASNMIMFEEGRNAYYSWMRDQIRANTPYDVIVRALLTTDGKTFQTGAANYIVRNWQNNGPIQDTYDNLSADTAEAFLGLQLNCLSCHSGQGHLEQVNTGLAKRTRQEFWRNAAFFAQLSIENPFEDEDYEWRIGTNPAGSYKLNTKSGNKSERAPSETQSTPVEPEFILTGEKPSTGEARRAAYARILTAHPQFARATVNYLWKEIFGMGIVEPADNFDLLKQDTQPTHPALLTKLATWFSANGYDLRGLLRLMVRSNAYQLSSHYTVAPWSETYTTYYARRYPRRMLAESVIDAVARATNVPVSIPVAFSTPVPRAMALPDPREPNVRNNVFLPILRNFGRGDRDATPRTRDGSISQALQMLNDPVITTRVKTRAAELLKTTHDPATIADELYVATLSRLPSSAERAAAVAYLNDGELVANTEDLQYALINRLEFLFN